MDAGSDNTRVGLWLLRGVTAGALFAAVEGLFAVFSGYNIPFVFLLALVGINTLGGLLIGLAVGVSFKAAKFKPGSSFATAFVLLAIGTSFVFFLDKAAAVAERLSLSLFSVVFLLALVLVSLSLVLLWLMQQLCRTKRPELSLAISILLLGVFLVGGNVITRTMFISYFSAGSILAHAALALPLLGGILLQDRFFTHSSKSPAIRQHLVALSVIVGATSVVFLGRILVAPAQPPVEESVRAATAQGNPPVVLISIDTLRSDHVSAYGYYRRTTPHLDRLASESVIYRNALSPSTWTLPGHASMLTGTLPRRHSAHSLIPEKEELSVQSRSKFQLVPGGTAARPLHPDNLTLAEILASAGYRTAAIVANAGWLGRAFGLDQGFDFYDVRHEKYFGYRPAFTSLIEFFPSIYYTLQKSYRVAHKVNQVALQWLESNSTAPFFLFLNYMEPHDPYCAPFTHQRMFSGKEASYHLLEQIALTRSRQLSDVERKHLTAFYDEEIAYVDEQIGLLIEELKRLGVYDNTMIVVTSDHGEFLGEHGLWGHGLGAYEEVYRVPLMVKYPRSVHRGIAENWVQTIDIVPTVLEVVGGIPTPSTIHGQPLMNVDHPIVTEQYQNLFVARNYAGTKLDRAYRGLYEYPWKLVSYSDGSLELYNLQEDPTEQYDQSADRIVLAREMQIRLEQHMASVVPIVRPDETTPILDKDVLEGLKALGYHQ